jgi:hypothetical protein
VGDGRDRRRVAAAVAALAVMWSKLPWTGQAMRSHGGWQSWLGVVEQQAYCWLALGMLAALWWLVARPADRAAAEPVRAGVDGVDAAEAAPALAGTAPEAVPPVTRPVVADAAVSPPPTATAARPRGVRRSGEA